MSSSAEEEFSEGLLSVVKPAVESVDAQVQTLRTSQAKLKDCIDNLSGDLANIAEMQKDLPNLEHYVKKRKKCNYKNSKITIQNVMDDITSYREILEHVQKQFKESYVTSDKYKLEFDQLKAHSDGLMATQGRDDGWLQYNRCKNRYKDILPYDKTRVRLPVIKNIAGSDYINASHISGPEGYVNYIAAQGPLPGTVFDFWRMVWYNYATVIVMVCKEVEMGKNKCANYWGKGPGDALKRGNFSVTLVSEKQEESYIVRKLVLNCADVTREVFQYQYLNWPDRDVPTDGEPLNKMLTIVRDKCPARPTTGGPGSPIVIHCSAGCGRTGTVLAIDYIDILIRNQQLYKEFSLFELVKKMRTERVAICQTKQQYGFVYYTALQLLDSAIEMLNMRSEAVSDAIYENVPHSPSHTIEEGTLIDLDLTPASQTDVLTIPPIEKPLKPSKPPKPDRPKSMIGLLENKQDAFDSLGTKKDTGLVESLSSKAPSASVSAGDKVTSGGEVEEPLYASVNPFVRTGKLVDLGDKSADEPPPLPASPSFDSDEEQSPELGSKTDFQIASSPARSKPLASPMEPGTGPLPPASHPPHLTTAPPKSPNLAAKRQSTPSSSPTPSRHLISSQQSLPERPQPSFDNGLVSGEQDIYPDIRLTHPEQTPISPKKPDLGYYSSVDRSQNMLDNGRLEEVEGCYSRLIISDLMPISEKSKSSDILADPSSENSQSSDNLLGSRNVTITPAEDNAYSTILDNQSGSDQTGKLTSPRFDEDNYSELSIPHSDVTDGPSNIPPSSGDDDENEDVYETFDDKASKSKEKVEKTNSKVPSVSKKSKSSKGFGFKGLLANISDNAHSASQNLKTKSQNMNIKSLTGSNNTASVYQDLPDMQYESEFGKRTGTPRGPREMPSHWIQI
ncbi:hypothetical protein ACHWQZ_G009857 [Mnemiopsis leidyi]